MKVVLIFQVLTLVIVSATGLAINSLIKDEWETFKSRYSKVYSNEIEEEFRMQVYLEKREMIANHNRNSRNGFKLKMNKFGDLLTSEINSLMNGYKADTKGVETGLEPLLYLAPENFQAPDEVDWREEGYVTPVKDQGLCGSCWSFSATGALEGQHMRKYGELVSLSEQNLMDCSWSEGNQACGGGASVRAFTYIKKNKGVDTEESYPYEAKEDTCRFQVGDVGANDSGYSVIKQGDETALRDAVASVGPISVAIDANHTSFHQYADGVYYEEECSSEKLDHAVLVVGYGTEDGEDYYLVKNSWGEDWGDQGYIKMARNRQNNCGIASAALFPIV